MHKKKKPVSNRVSFHCRKATKTPLQMTTYDKYPVLYFYTLTGHNIIITEIKFFGALNFLRPYAVTLAALG